MITEIETKSESKEKEIKKRRRKPKTTEIKINPPLIVIKENVLSNSKKQKRIKHAPKSRNRFYYYFVHGGFFICWHVFCVSVSWLSIPPLQLLGGI